MKFMKWVKVKEVKENVKPPRAIINPNTEKWQSLLPFTVEPNTRYLDVECKLVNVLLAYNRTGLVNFIATFVNTEQKVIRLRWIPIGKNNTNTYKVAADTYVLRDFNYANAIVDLLTNDFQTLLNAAHSHYPSALSIAVDKDVTLSWETKDFHPHLLDIKVKHA